MRKLLFILLLFPIVGFGQIETLLINENFSNLVPGTGLPYLWNVPAGGGNCAGSGFNVESAMSYWNGPLNSILSGSCIVADSYNNVPCNETTQLITPSVSAQFYDSVKVVFDIDYMYGTYPSGVGQTGSGSSVFSMYVWDGSTDNFVFSVTQIFANNGLFSGTYNADITQYITSGTTKVKFKYEGYDGWHCALDNIYIVGYSSPQTGCTDSLACNYDATANTDDGSCAYASTSTDIIVSCDLFTWLDGVTYTASNNTATFTSTNAAGCDNIATLDLTINNS